MKKVKKLLAILLAIVLTLSLAACGSGDSDSGSGSDEVVEFAETGITVLPVEGLSEDFTMGVDVSSLIAEEESGVVYYDANGDEADLMKILSDAGVNCVRIRVWNDPYDSEGHTYGAGTCDIDVACEIGKRATDYGLGVLIDFHYSDFWSDPSKYTAPKAWADYSVDEKVEAVSEFTTECLEKLGDAGVNVTMVQVGNEINNGMAGETSDDAICKMLASGADAVRAYDENIQIVIHYTDPLSEGYLEGKAYLLQQYNVDYDVLATSYYPFWHGDLDELTAVLKSVADTYGVKVMVAETSYAYTNDDGDGYGNVVSTYSTNQAFNYPFTVEGQAVSVRDVIEAVSNVGEAGLGVFYWEPAWIPVPDDSEEGGLSAQEKWEEYGSGWATSYASEYDAEVTASYNGGTWDNQAFFDFDGHVLESLYVFKYVYTGAYGPLAILRVEDEEVEFEYGAENALPDTVTVTLNDGTTREAAVTWDEEEAAAVLNDPDFGEYEVNGVADEIVEDGAALEGDYTVTCAVTVTAYNYITNGSFETGDATGWTLVNDLDAGWPKVDKNESNAKEGAYYYTAWAEDYYDFTLYQTIDEELPTGVYRCFAYFQGTGIDNPPDTQFTVTVTSTDGTTTDYSVDVTIPNVWLDWFVADISGIAIDENTASVTVTAHIACQFEEGSTANGAWVVMDDVNFLKAE